MNLPIKIKLDEDGWYVAECPSLPGCVSQGKTEQEARENIREAISGWILADASKVNSSINH